MNTILKNIQGDRTLWAIVALLAIFSFLPVYSASSNLQYVVGTGTTTGYLIKHATILLLGFAIMYAIHQIPYHYFRALSILLLPIAILLLIYTLSKGVTISGANASRWIRLPMVGVSFQPSTFAVLILMIYVAHYVSKIKEKSFVFKESILPLWLPVFLTLALILPANFSTAAILFVSVMALCFLGGYPIKYLLGIIAAAVLAFTFFILLAKAFPDALPNRVDTWISRMENFSSNQSTQESYQVERAKTAIASGGIIGLGAGKSVMKSLLPQSASDFIYALIAEEYGFLGALTILLLYLFLLFRIVVIVNKTQSTFGKLLAVAVGVPVVFQALINMAVAVALFPVTGQTLPLISSGGTSVWMSCLAFGILLSVSRKKEQINRQLEHNQDNPLAVLSETL